MRDKKEYNKRWRLAHPQKVDEYNKRYYEAHRELIKERSAIASKKRRERVGKRQIAEENRHYTQLRKRLVLTHYGNGKLACVRCGFSNIRALSIDHINGGGCRGRKGFGGNYWYHWLIKNNYPQGYQTLCMNCNWIKRFENNE